MLCFFYSVIGLFGGPVVAAIYSASYEVLSGQHVPELFSLSWLGSGIGQLIGPPIAGKIICLIY